MPPRLSLVAVVLTVMLSVSAGVALAAFSATSSNGANTFSVTSGPDGTPPTISRAVAAKTTGATPGTIRQGGAYYVYAEVTDNGAISSVTANTSTFDTGVTAAALTTAGGPWTVGGLSYNYRSASLTSNTPITTGASYSYSVLATDASTNTDSENYNAAIESYAATILATGGLVSQWRLGDGVYGADDLDDSDGVLLHNHTSNTGATWTKHAALIRNAEFTPEGRIRKSGDDGALYYTSTVPGSADYVVEGDVHVKSAIANDTGGIIGRMDHTNGNGTFYQLRYNVGNGSNGNFSLWRQVDGTSATIASYADNLAAGTTRQMKLEFIGTTIKAYIDGVERLSVTDANIAGPGRGGFRIGGPSQAPVATDSAGLHFDNFRISSRTTTAVDDPGVNDGTYTNGVRLNEPGALVGDINRAARFDGVNDYVTVPDAGTLDLTNGPMSAEAWVKRHDAVGATWDTIFHKGTAAYQIAFNGSDYSLLKDGTATIVGAAGTAGDLTAFHHWVATKNGTTSKLYKDGVDVTGTVTNQTLANTSTALFIAAKSGTSEFLNATLDELALYNSELSVTDALDHYNAGRGTG